LWIQTNKAVLLFFKLFLTWRLGELGGSHSFVSLWFQALPIKVNSTVLSFGFSIDDAPSTKPFHRQDSKSAKYSNDLKSIVDSNE
jgi:hypothetical protein